MEWHISNGEFALLIGKLLGTLLAIIAISALLLFYAYKIVLFAFRSYHKWRTEQAGSMFHINTNSDYKFWLIMAISILLVLSPWLWGLFS